MKISNIISSKTVGFLQGSTTSGNIFMPDFTRLMQENFRFLQVPTKLEEFNASNGVKFVHGEFEGIVIDLLEVYENGVVISTKTNTNNGNKFIDALIKLASKEFNFEVTNVPHMKKIYVSELDVISEKNLDSIFDSFKGILKIINNTVSQYGDDIPPYEGTGFLIVKLLKII